MNLAETDFKAAVINIFKELKKPVLYKLGESKVTLSHTESIHRGKIIKTPSAEECSYPNKKLTKAPEEFEGAPPATAVLSCPGGSGPRRKP